MLLSFKVRSFLKIQVDAKMGETIENKGIIHLNNIIPEDINLEDKHHQIIQEEDKPRSDTLKKCYI